MKIFGITGTNGKTTTTWILDTFLGGGGYVTTVEVNTGRRRFSTGYTTPPLPVLKEIFAEILGYKSFIAEIFEYFKTFRLFPSPLFRGFFERYRPKPVEPPEMVYPQKVKVFKSSSYAVFHKGNDFFPRTVVVVNGIAPELSVF